MEIEFAVMRYAVQHGQPDLPTIEFRGHAYRREIESIVLPRLVLQQQIA